MGRQAQGSRHDATVGLGTGRILLPWKAVPSSLMDRSTARGTLEGDFPSEVSGVFPVTECGIFPFLLGNPMAILNCPFVQIGA